MPKPQPLSRAILFIEEFRKIDPDISAPVALVLLHIARKPGITNRELGQLLGMAKSTTSRHIEFLSKELGKGLITYSEDLQDRRYKVIKLTPEGERVVRSLLHFIGDEGE